jgi:hypothetical protein
MTIGYSLHNNTGTSLLVIGASTVGIRKWSNT